MPAKLKQAITISLTSCLLSTAVFANEVELRSPDGAMTITGTLTGYDDAMYFLSTTVGEMRVERAKVNCIGATCPQQAAIKADLTIRGSDTIGDELMPLLLEGYAEHINATIAGRQQTGADMIALTAKLNDGSDAMIAEVQAAGSSTGFKALINRETDIAMSSRPARAKEIKTIASQGRGNLVDLSQEYIIAVDSILTIVSPENPVNQLRMDQLTDIFAGRITNWSQVGGPNRAITVVTRPETSGTRGVFEKAILAPDGSSMSPKAVVLGSNKEITDLVAKDPGAIGYAGFAYKGDTKGLDLVSSCGIRMSASAFNAKTEEYPLQRRLRLFVDNSKPVQHAQGLLDFAISKEADTFVREAGFIDLSVDTDRDAVDAAYVRAAARQNGEPLGLDKVDSLLTTLAFAERLSTTFRFVTGSARMDNKSLRDLGRMVEFLEKPENRNREIIVAGFTDNVGGFAYNQRLSQKRSQTIADALTSEIVKRGLPKLNMRTVGFSELAPVGCNDSDQGRERNRRVELWIK